MMVTTSPAKIPRYCSRPSMCELSVSGYQRANLKFTTGYLSLTGVYPMVPLVFVPTLWVQVWIHVKGRPNTTSQRSWDRSHQTEGK